jgi:hypothetical protein
MGGRRGGRRVAVALAVLIIGDMRLQAGRQRRGATALQRRRQVVADIGIAEFACIGYFTHPFEKLTDWSFAILFFFFVM